MKLIVKENSTKEFLTPNKFSKVQPLEYCGNILKSSRADEGYPNAYPAKMAFKAATKDTNTVLQSRLELLISASTAFQDCIGDGISLYVLPLYNIGAFSCNCKLVTLGNRPILLLLSLASE